MNKVENNNVAAASLSLPVDASMLLLIDAGGHRAAACAAGGVSYLDVHGWSGSTIVESCVLGWRWSNAVLEKSVKRGGVSSATACAFFVGDRRRGGSGRVQNRTRCLED
jgi:hypothetical protein